MGAVSTPQPITEIELIETKPAAPIRSRRFLPEHWKTNEPSRTAGFGRIRFGAGRRAGAGAGELSDPPGSGACALHARRGDRHRRSRCRGTAAANPRAAV